MLKPSNSGKVLIVGGGLGGLALAQGLYAHGVPFEIFERDASPDTRKQGWAIALVEAIAALKELLPAEALKDLPSVSVNRSTGENDDMAFVNAVTGERVAVVGGRPHDQPGGFIRANRNIFRTFLWKSNGLSVTSNKGYTHYALIEDGVTAFFKDGSNAHGGILVGADGLNSRVLKQLLGETEHKPVLSHYVPIFGELDLPPEQFEPLRRLGNSAVPPRAQH